jgi:hypothetical protein
LENNTSGVRLVFFFVTVYSKRYMFLKRMIGYYEAAGCDTGITSIVHNTGITSILPESSSICNTGRYWSLPKYE